MSDALFVAARFVDLPDAHAGIAPSLEPQAAGSPPIAPIRIQHSEKEPPFPYRVQHRGYWFYVDDADVQSKMFLEAMVAAYASRVGMKQTDDGQPQLVLPVGGGSS
jgi:hypothetical protein